VIAAPSFGIQGIKVGALGNIYVAGQTNIAKYSPTGTQLWRLRSHGGSAAPYINGDTSLVKFSQFGGIDVDPTETKIYFVNTNFGTYGSQIKVLDLTAKTITTVAGDGAAGYSDGAAADAEFYFAYSVTLDKSGGVYVADNGNAAIRYIKGGNVSTVIGGNGASYLEGIGTQAQLVAPQNVVLDSKGNMYIADWGTGTSAGPTSNKIWKVVID
jgi:sugar lactone lactonase YvrE